MWLCFRIWHEVILNYIPDTDSEPNFYCEYDSDSSDIWLNSDPGSDSDPDYEPYGDSEFDSDSDFCYEFALGSFCDFYREPDFVDYDNGCDFDFAFDFS